MAQLLLPGEIVALSGQAADRLLRLDNGDAALLYLHLLRHGDLRGVTWPEPRLRPALEALRAQDMAPAEAPLPDPEPREVPPPEYSSEDLVTALSDQASPFSALCDEVERRLNKQKLSPNELKQLLTLYDHLNLLMLVGWCSDEMARKYKSGKRPSMSYISRQGFAWARRGIDTMERAEEYLQRLARLHTREEEVLRLLDIPPRPLVEREKSYIAAWDEMGFDDETLRMAYEKTVLKKQSMDWSYMNGILRRDHDPRPVRAGGPAPQRPAPPEEDRRAREDMERMRRLMEQMKQEGEP